MKCPNCIEKLSKTDSSGIQTYSCINCNGAWVTSKALDLLLRQQKSSLTSQALVSNCVGKPFTTRHCPSCCDKKLHVINTYGIEIDICPKCYGIFFDKNEMEIILPNTYRFQSKIGSAVPSDSLFWVIAYLITGGS